MRKIIIPVLLSILFLFSCGDPDILFIIDEKYYEVMQVTDDLETKLKRSASARGLSAGLEFYMTEQKEPDLSSLISERDSKVILLSPYLSKRVEAYSRLLPDRLFCTLDANGRSESDKLAVIYKDRDRRFETLAEDIYQFQKRGQRVGTCFLLSESRRNREKNLFKTNLTKLNSGNYQLIEAPVYQTDMSRLPREVTSKMVREQVDVLLLFAASLNSALLEELPAKGEVMVITEGLYPSDGLYTDRVLFSLNYDYTPAFESFALLAYDFLAGTALDPERLNIPLEVRDDRIAPELEPEVEPEADLVPEPVVVPDGVPEVEINPEAGSEAEPEVGDEVEPSGSGVPVDQSGQSDGEGGSVDEESDREKPADDSGGTVDSGKP